MPQDKVTRQQFAADIKRRKPELASIPDDKLVDLMVQREPKFADYVLPESFPTGQMSRSDIPRPINAEEYLKNWIKGNQPTIGGIGGGIVGGLAAGPPGAVIGSGIGGAVGKGTEQKTQGKKLDWEDIAFSGGEQGLFELGGQAMAWGSKFLKPTPLARFISFGARSGEYEQAIKSVQPDLAKLAKASRFTKTPDELTISEFRKLQDDLSHGYDAEWSSALFPVRGQRVIPMQVASDIANQITANMPMTSFGRGEQRYIRARSREFMKPWSIAKLDAERKTIGKRLSSFYELDRVEQSAMRLKNPQIAVDEAASNAIKDILYPYADRTGAKPAGYFKNLKQKQSNLMSIMQTTQEAQRALTKISAEREGAPLLEKFHLRGYMHTSGLPSGASMLEPSRIGDPLEVAGKQIKKGFPGSVAKTRRAAQTGVAKALSWRDVDALPIRYFFSNPVEEQQGAPQ